jgi:hypothetical protein
VKVAVLQFWNGCNLAEIKGGRERERGREREIANNQKYFGIDI